ncbi:unnamed protein product [Lactuca virosa]|uniref:Uncharacterized protein n=1 Tax=Lactuca virosa TaxID=75947 RepID=A0AAU9MLA4_9ASTR|nr:unnamed protein product [Lactuca virosa]
MVLQQFLIRVIKYVQHFIDILNYKFDEVLKRFEDTLEELKKQDPNVDAYDNLTKVVNVSFQKVFEKFGKLKDQVFLALKVGPSYAIGGEGTSGGWNKYFKH